MSPLDALLRKPALRRLLEKAEAECAAETGHKRAQLGATLEEIDRMVAEQLSELGPKLREAKERLSTVLAEKTEAVFAAGREVDVVARKIDQFDQMAKAERATIVNMLVETCPPEVNTLISDIDEAVEAMRTQVISMHIDTIKVSDPWAPKVLGLFSNRAAVERKIEGLVNAAKAAWSLRSRYVPDLAAEIQAIRDSVSSLGISKIDVTELPR